MTDARPHARPDGPATRGPLARFAGEERGSLTILALFFFVCMLMIGGLCVDMMIFENNRTRLQSVADRAVLAAADLDQSLDPTEVVESYFQREGLEKYLREVKIEGLLEGRTVTADAAQPMRTMFMRLVGVNELTAPAVSTAVEGISNIEVSLVLDNSGSMGTIDSHRDRRTRLEKLQDATRTFLDKIYDGKANDRISVSVVPYSTQVNAGPEILSYMKVTDEHSYSDCIEFSDSEYDTTAIDPKKTLYQRAAHFDMFNSDPTPRDWACRPESTQWILPFGHDPEVIQARIEALTAKGQTSLEIGAKWGAALLDPSTRPIVRSLANDPRSGVLKSFNKRPANIGDENTVKALVLMTDGINTQHPVMNAAYRSGPSPLYRGYDNKLKADVFSMARSEQGDEDHDGIANEKYWVPAVKVGNATVLPAQYSNLPLGKNPAQMSWPDVWAVMPPEYFAETFVRGMNGSRRDRDDFLDGLWHWVSPQLKDTRLDRICTQMKDRGIPVYTIGVNVNNHSRQVLQDCASTPNFFLDVSDDQLAYAFNAIALSIQQLKLTQ